MDSMFTLRVNNFNLSNSQEFAKEIKKTFKCGLETVSYACPQLWTLVPNTIQKLIFLIELKSKIKF